VSTVPESYDKRYTQAIGAVGEERTDRGGVQHPRLGQGPECVLSDVDVWLHADVPSGGGGIALGQAGVVGVIARR
jgi:hypothetical protein